MIHNLLKKSIILTMIVSILITFLGQGICTISDNQQIIKSSSESVEFIDQSNDGEGCGGCDGGGTGVTFLAKDVGVAQSFTPTHTSVSKVSLTISQSGSPPLNTQLTLSIRDSLIGDDLTSVVVPATEGSIMFDFEDIAVISGNTYYMVCTADNSTGLNNGYGWSYTKEDQYLSGSAWINKGSGWHNLDDDISGTGADMFFDTYWKDYCPNTLSITGTSEGKAQQRYDYTFTATDPEGHDTEYYIDWGDGKSYKWIGPYASGEPVTRSHQWASKDNYTIRLKARDIYGAESDWTELPISMPKTKALNSPILRFLENNPQLFPILRHLLFHEKLNLYVENQGK